MSFIFLGRVLKPVGQSPREPYCDYSTARVEISTPLEYIEQNSQLVCSLLKEVSCSVFWKSPECSKQRPRMPKAAKSSSWGATSEPNHKKMTPSSQYEHSSSGQEPDPEITFHPSRQPQLVPSMFMPYIEGPKMGWTANDGFYHRFLKWCLKCENILEFELAALPECQQCKKVIA